MKDLAKEFRVKTDGAKEVHRWQKIQRRLTGSKQENNRPGVQIEAVKQSRPILQELSLISSLVHKTCMAQHHHFTVHHPAAETGGIKMGFFTPLLCHNHLWLPYPSVPCPNCDHDWCLSSHWS